MNHIKHQAYVGTFEGLWPGQYFRSIYTGAIFVKRTEWYAESILLSGLADNSSCWEFSKGTMVEMLEEDEWPEIDYRQEVLDSWKWDKIKAEISSNIYLDEEGQPHGSMLLGTILNTYPSGKIYAPWTSNQTPEDINRDRQFNEALEAVAEEYGVHIDYFDCDIFARKGYTFEEVAKAAGFELSEYCDQYSWIETKDRTNSSVPFETEEEAWEDCCKENKLVNE